MDAKTMDAAQVQTQTFQPNSGTIGTLLMLFGEPQTTSSQGPIISTSPPPGATQINSQPFGIPAQEVSWKNLNTAFQASATAGWSFSAVERNSRVNPGLMRTVPWAALTAALPSSVKGGSTVTITVTSAAPAPSAGLTVTLVSASSGFKLSQTSVVIPSGKTTATVVLTTTKVKSATVNRVMATASGETAMVYLTATP